MRTFAVGIWRAGEAHPTIVLDLAARRKLLEEQEQRKEAERDGNA